MDDRPQQRILTLIAIALTFASGATDVASYTRLGNVFTSVMTGNIVLLGLAVARHSLTLASHTLVSIAGYITGVAGGTWIAHGFRVAGAAAGSGAAGSGAAGAAAKGLLLRGRLINGMNARLRDPVCNWQAGAAAIPGEIDFDWAGNEIH